MHIIQKLRGLGGFPSKISTEFDDLRKSINSPLDPLCKNVAVNVLIFALLSYRVDLGQYLADLSNSRPFQITIVDNSLPKLLPQ